MVLGMCPSWNGLAVPGPELRGLVDPRWLPSQSEAKGDLHIALTL